MHQREVMEFDVAIVGAGPAGLAAAIRLRQLLPECSVCVLEKGAEVGAHIISGAAIETRALDELLPDWRERKAPIHIAATADKFYLLSEKSAFRLPTPRQMHNDGNYIVSLGQVCRWLGEQAEALGVQIFPGFPAVEAIIEEGHVKGVITGDFGRGRNGEEKPGFQSGVAIRAAYTLFAEGCRGSLSQQLMEAFQLRGKCDPQTYAIGIKEIWEVDATRHRRGEIVHSVGWPLGGRTYGGSFLYHADANQVYIGLITGLDYKNPYLDPFREFQRMKHHPLFSKVLEGGRRIAYGSRAINEGGLQSLPGLAFPGGALIGCAAGFLNVPKIKGSHLAMKSGMLAAEAVTAALPQGTPLLEEYPTLFRQSWAWQELHSARNIRPAFRHGLWAGLAYSALDTYLLQNRAPWTLRHHTPDHATLTKAAHAKPLTYPAPDGTLSFDRMSSVYLSNTAHEEDQPVHLRLRDKTIPTAYNLPEYAAPEQRYCPAGVYEIIEKDGRPALQINAQNCVHCKTCDIKDPCQNIQWAPPEGGGGPNYSGM